MNTQQMNIVADAMEEIEADEEALTEKEQEFIFQMQAKIEDGSARSYELSQAQAWLLLRISEKT